MPTYATDIVNTPSGSITSTTVQSAINELAATAAHTGIIDTIASTASTNDTIRWNGSDLISSGALKNDGTNVTVSGTLKVDAIESTVDLHITSATDDVYINTTGASGRLTLNATNVEFNGTVLKQCDISSTGDVTMGTGSDVAFCISSNETAPSAEIIAQRVWNSVYNDIVDFQPKRFSNERIMPGECCYETGEGVSKCTEIEHLPAVVGIVSDTFGIACGAHRPFTIPIAIAGWVLAYVDQVYPPGTQLMPDDAGRLTIASDFNKHNHPEYVVARYMRKETNEFWGPSNNIQVNGRHWVKVV